MYRHVRHSCKIANSDEGMEKLLEHTLARQLHTQHVATVALQAQVAHQAAQVEELAALLRRQLALAPPSPAPSTTAPAVALEGCANASVRIVQNNVQNNVQNITIRPWNGGGGQLCVTALMLRAAFTENARLAEYCRLDGPDQVDAEKAAPYVLEALVELVRRAHANPEARNVYLNPRRADQVLVFDAAAWKVLTLVDAIRALFDGAAQGIKRIILSDADRAQLSQEVQSAAAGIPYLYEDEAEAFITKARKPLAAHLANTGPEKAPAQALAQC